MDPYTQDMKLCSFEGCKKDHYGHGYCSGHLAQIRRGQELKPLRRRSKQEPVGDKCECGREAYRRNLCKWHLMESMYGRCPLCNQVKRGNRDWCLSCERRGGPPIEKIGRRINNDFVRYCWDCKKTLSVDHFYGRKTRCKECLNANRTLIYGELRTKIYQWFAETVVQTSEGLCCKCHREMGHDWHMDHIVPLSLGGPTNINNIQILCSSCNTSKKNRESVDYRQWIEGKEEHARHRIEELLTKYRPNPAN